MERGADSRSLKRPQNAHISSAPKLLIHYTFSPTCVTNARELGWWETGWKRNAASSFKSYVPGSRSAEKRLKAHGERLNYGLEAMRTMRLRAIVTILTSSSAMPFPAYPTGQQPHRWFTHQIQVREAFHQASHRPALHHHSTISKHECNDCGLERTNSLPRSVFKELLEQCNAWTSRFEADLTCLSPC